MPAVAVWDRETWFCNLLAPRESKDESLADAEVGRIFVLSR